MLNDVKLHGRLTAKPELRTTRTDKKTTTFTLAVDRNGKDAGADFIQVTAWNKIAELLAQHFEKGQQVIVEARLQTRTVKDKNGDKSHTVMEVVAQQVYFCGSKPATVTAAEAEAPTEDNYEEDE